MATRNIASFKATKNARYTANTSGDISSGDGSDMFEDVADSFLNRTDDLIDDDTFDTASSSNVASAESTKAYVDSFIVPLASTGTAIAFDKARTYGYTTAETGNITINTTGLKEGVTQLVIHNHSSTPTFGAECKIISGEYATGVVNYIFLHSVSSSLVLVTISQEI